MISVALFKNATHRVHEGLVPFGANETQASLLEEQAAGAALWVHTLYGIIRVVKKRPPTLTWRLRRKLQTAHV